jgi:hypothetical protein
VNHKKTLQSLVDKIITIEKEIGNGINFHKKISQEITEFGKFKLVATVFEENIKQKSFVNKKWTSCEIPQLTIFQNEKMTIKYHFFLPIKNLDLQHAAYLIHHHGNNILNSHIFYGSGYQTIEFGKDVLQQSDGSFKLKISKDLYHSKGCTNIVEDWTPHVIFNIEEACASIALWSDLEFENSSEERMNYYLKNNKFYGLTDSEFSSKIYKNEMFEDNSEVHIQAICYFMQRFNYENDIFISKILSNINKQSLWVKWLKKLKNKGFIGCPFITGPINTLGNKININDLRKIH